MEMKERKGREDKEWVKKRILKSVPCIKTQAKCFELVSILMIYKMN
jgi:hypothetical protein